MTVTTPNHWFANGEVEDYRVPVDFVLPLKMLSFNAAFQGNSKVAVEWRTGKEINFEGFVVEKSADGRNWEPAATVAGHADNNAQNDYMIYDNQPIAGKSYYRLRLGFTDGHTEYSEIRMVEWKSADIWMKITPNPVRDHAMIQFSADKQESAVITITGASGAVVLQKNISAVKGFNQVSLNDCNRLSPGIYLVQLKTSFSVMSTKMIIE
jgi:hypothetical protein